MIDQGQLTQRQRISSIDLVRGAVMVIMALDHVRDFFHIGFWLFDPTDLSRTTPVIFLTRWITHFCAPTFVLLSGVSAQLGLQRKTPRQLARFLLSRGLWLIALEVTVIRFGFFGNLFYDITMIQVIYAIGGSMVVLALLLYLNVSTKAILITGLVIIVGHDLLNSAQVSPESPFHALALLVFQFGFHSFTPEHAIFVPYPLLPWLGIFLAGFGMGTWFMKDVDPEVRQKKLLRTGLMAVILFIVLRLVNVYGDPAPWSTQGNFLFTFLSFINCTKYPVSLLYTFMTLGPVLILLSWLEKFQAQSLQPLVVFGRVPMFYYILHIYFIHLAAIGIHVMVSDQTFASLDFHTDFQNWFGGLPRGSGYRLRWVYGVWATLVLALYPFCNWYNRYKSNHHHWWLSYL